MKKKYAAVGTGGRIPMFIDPIAGTYAKDAELVGLCDTNAARRTYHQRRLTEAFGLAPVPLYDDFTQMLRECQPDVVIVCTPDYLHHRFVVEALEFGAEVICEKPLTTDAEKCCEIFEALERTGGSLRTTFNLRWAPGASRVRELIAVGEVGRVRHIDFEYALNTSHGADYFRRWHSQKEFSGGLLIHKSTHHFDMISWWVDAVPATVYAMGELVYYGKANAIERGDEPLTKYERYTGYDEAKSDPFHMSLEDDEDLRGLYLDGESEDGYIRDRNVFREGITIEDSMSVMVKYRNGTMLTYSLNAYCPVEGFRATISGDRGRIEYVEEHDSHIITGGGKPMGGGAWKRHLTLQKLFAEPVVVPIETREGGHGGGDPLLQEQLFSRNPPEDPLGRHVGHEQAAASMLIGVAANESIATGQPVEILKLLDLRPGATRLSELI